MFFFSFALRFINGDKLLIYAIGVSVCISFFQLVILSRCQYLFDECHVKSSETINKVKLKSLLKFSAWNAIGTLGGIGRDQGSTILLNLFFGPQVNAAYSIANKLSTQSNQLGFALIGALAPEISACEGKGDRKRVISLSLRSGLWGTILLLVIAIPLLFELDGILAVWLVSVPEYSADFCRLIIITFMIDRLGTGYLLAFNAVGDIAKLQLYTGVLLLFSLPLSYILFVNGLPPPAIAISFLVSIVALLITRIFIGKRILDIPVLLWIKKVFIPFVFAIGSMCLIAFLCTMLKWPLLIRTCFSCALCCFLSLMLVIFSIPRNERRIFFRKYMKLDTRQF